MATDPTGERVLLIHVSRSDGDFRARLTHGSVADRGSTVENLASEEDVVQFVRAWVSQLSPADAGESFKPPEVS